MSRIYFRKINIKPPRNAAKTPAIGVLDAEQNTITLEAMIPIKDHILLLIDCHQTAAIRGRRDAQKHPAKMA